MSDKPPPYGQDPAYPPPQAQGQGYGQPPPPGYGQPPPPGYGQPPPPAGYGQPQVVVAQPTTMVTTVVGVTQGFRESPVATKCPHCTASIVTATHFQTGMLTWLAAGLLCLFGLWLGCCLIPFCIDACKDVVHTCPNCNRLIHLYSRLS